MDNNINHYGKQNSILFYAVPGTFASDAWRTGDKTAYEAVLGSKFTAITADDGREYNIGRQSLERISSQKELDELLSKAHPHFVLYLKCDEIVRGKEFRKRLKCILALHYISEILESHPEYSEAEVLDYFRQL